MNESTARPRPIIVASYNVRTLNHGGLFQLANGCCKHNIGMVAVQEHRQQAKEDLVHTKTPSGVFIYASATKRGTGGVGVFINKRLERFLLVSEKISDRIVAVHLEGSPITTFIAVYAPTESAEEADKLAFYHDLTEAVASVPPHNMLILAGDLNAQVGHDSHSACPRTVGPHLFHASTNDNGDRLVTLAEEQNLRFVQSRFSHKKGRLFTWTHPSGLHRAQIDHILIRAKWANSSRNCRAYNTVNLESDHRIVCAHLRLSLRVSARPQKRCRQPLWGNITDPDVRATFETELENRFSALRAESALTNSNMQAYYDDLLACVEDTAITVLGEKQRTRQPPWVSERTLRLIEERDRAKTSHSITPAKSSAKHARRRDWLVLVKQVKAALEQDEICFLEEQLHEMQLANNKNESSRTWKLIKKITGTERKPPVKVKSRSGKPIPERALLGEWRLHFEDLLNNKLVNPDTLNTTPPPQQAARVLAIQTSQFSRAEVEAAIASLKNNKAPGTDRIVTAALLKHGGDFIVSTSLNICNAVYNGSTPPWQWTTNSIVPVPKKGDRSRMTNYRGISLMSTWAKLYNKMLLFRLRPAVDQILRNNQAGFRPGRSAVEQINALRRVIEGAKRKQLALVIVFVDFKKAFDSIIRIAMYNILLQYGIPLVIVEAIKRLYDNSKGMVMVNGKLSEPFCINTGVLQGDVLAPFLFIIVIDHIMKGSCAGHGFEYVKGNGSRSPAKTLNDLDYADDIALLEKLVTLANDQLGKLSSEARKVGLVINADKTEYMAFNQPSDQPGIVLDGLQLQQVADFQYLGSRMSCTRVDFKRRKGLAWAVFWDLEKIWRASHVSLALKVNIFKASVLSVFLYGCETWIICSTMANKINSFATSCYRIMLGIRSLDKVRNDHVYNSVGEQPLLVSVQQRQLRWVGHALRRDDMEPARIFALYEPGERLGKAAPGAPPTSYKHYIASLLTSAPKDLSAAQISDMASNRKQWAKRIADIGK